MIIAKPSCSTAFQNYFKWLFWIVLLLFSLSVPCFGQRTTNEMEAQVKAAYIYNFSRLLQWPKNNPNYFYIFIFGKSPIADPLYKIASKEKINGKTIIVNEISDLSDIESGGILYLAYNEKHMLNEAIEKTKGKNIVLISSIEGSAEKGIGITLLRVGDKIKFEINRKAIESEGIIPKSTLFSIAYRVYE
jgi:hypothetical protein